MASDLSALKVGDPIEVRRAIFDHGKFHDWWAPATVQATTEHVIVAVYADGQRHAVERKNVRRALIAKDASNV